MQNKKYAILFFIYFNIVCKNYITNDVSVQLGDGLINFSIAKILALKYPDKIELLYRPFMHHELFALETCEKKLDYNSQFSKTVFVRSDEDIINNKEDNVLFIATLGTKVNSIDDSLIKELKKVVKLKKIPKINELPDDLITVAVHIRKGNGGGAIYDGEQSSLQIFDFERSQVKYVNDFFNYPFDWESYQRKDNILNNIQLKNYKDYAEKWTCEGKPRDRVDYFQVKLPPDQFYIDQIKKLSHDLNNSKLFVQIFTDDRNPFELLERIKENINLPNVTICYENNWQFSFHERVEQDLFGLSRTDILIRPQSNFSRMAELIGNHKIVIYPLEFSWVENNKLVMDKIVIKGNIDNLKNKNA